MVVFKINMCGQKANPTIFVNSSMVMSMLRKKKKKKKKKKKRRKDKGY